MKKEYLGEAGGIPGLVRVTINNIGLPLKVEIDDLVFKETDKELISDLFVAAMNDAYAKLDKDYQEALVNSIQGALQPYGGDQDPLPSYNLTDLISPDGSKKN